MKSLVKSLLVVAAVAAGLGNAQADSSVLIGRSITPKPLPPPALDANKQEFSDGYFICGGAVRKDGTHFNFLRKGVKARCDSGTRTVTLTRPRAGSKEERVLDAVDIKHRANHYTQIDCEGADLAMSKHEDAEYFTKHSAAWNVVNDKLVPVADLTKIRCVNDGY